jgi:hypothetical protein
MSKRRTISSGSELEDAARHLWEKDPDIHWHWPRPKSVRQKSPDVIAIATIDGKTKVFLAECKVNPTARDVEALARQKGQNHLLIAPHISESLLNLCRHRGISCADLNGRQWLRAKGLLVDRQPVGKKFRPAVTPADPFSTKGTRLIRSLLNHPDRLWSHKELVEATGLSKGLITRLVQRLINEGLMKQGKRTLSVERLGALLDAWARSDNWRKRAVIRQYSLLETEPLEIARKLNEALPESDRPVFTQWFAADLRRPYTIPPVVSAYVPWFPGGTQEKAFGARQVSDGGNLWLIQPTDPGVFRETQTVNGFKLACDAQIYLDLLQVGLRGPEQAEALREWNGFCKATA